MEAVPFIGVDRHRLGVDGVGVTTLAAFHGCPLRCRYCLNRRCLEPVDDLRRYTPEDLYALTAVDNLYFIATGGEPLIRMDFIEEFCTLFARIRTARYRATQRRAARDVEPSQGRARTM